MLLMLTLFPLVSLRWMLTLRVRRWRRKMPMTMIVIMYNVMMVRRRSMLVMVVVRMSDMWGMRMALSRASSMRMRVLLKLALLSFMMMLLLLQLFMLLSPLLLPKISHVPLPLSMFLPFPSSLPLPIFVVHDGIHRPGGSLVATSRTTVTPSRYATGTNPMAFARWPHSLLP